MTAKCHGYQQLPVCEPPGTLGSTMASYRDYADIVATQCSIKPRDPGMRFSQWLGTRTLNGVSQAREVVRCWAEAKVEASITSGLVGRLHNPYALSSKARATLPGEVELIDDDGAVAGVV